MISKEQIIQLILKGGPISIVRCGDGEKMVLDLTSSVPALRQCDNAVFQRQLGYSPSIKEAEEIRNNLIDAYSHCDVIGLPNHKQKTNKHWHEVVAVLHKNVPTRTDVVCDIDAAYQMLYDNDYDTILQDRNILNYVSCRDIDEGFKNKWDISRVNKFTISPEAKFTSGYQGDKHYPTQFNKIPRWMDVVIKQSPGSLLLVGAGVVGKIYCNWWRDRGGVAMDCGGVFDLWFGRVTRGAGRGLDKEDLMFKL